MLKVERLLCDGQHEFIGVPRGRPCFSWRFCSDKEGDYQTAYSMQVFENDSMIWNSGKVISGLCHMAPYEGPELVSRKRYEFKVCVWNCEDLQSEYEQSYFETAILSNDEWSAKWIGGNSLLRTEFSLSTKIRSARAYVTGLGYYECYINGEKLGNAYLSPSYTDYEKRIEYQVFDISENLICGNNAIGIMLAAHSKIKTYTYYKNEKMALLQIEVLFEDGKVVTIISDESWRCSKGPVVCSGIYDGEEYDARLELEGWANAEFEEQEWEGVTVYGKRDAILAASNLPPIKITQTINPISVSKLSENLVIVDLGQNIAGLMYIIVRGVRGSKVVIRHAELLNKDGQLNTENLRTADAIDTYILKGIGVESYHPRFTYHGFRYAGIEWEKGVELIDLKGMEVHTSVAEKGKFNCSSELINKIHKAMQYTIKNNLHSIPTDCPQRDERQGWLGDGHITAEAAIMNFDMHFFYRKWLADIMDTQDDNTGAIKGLSAPGCFRGENLEWTAASYLICWYLYKYYGDVDIVKCYYSSLAKFFKYLETHEKDGMLDIPGFGDWLGIQYTEPKYTVGFFYCYFAKIMTEFALALGKNSEVEKYKDKFKVLQDSYNQKYYSPIGYKGTEGSGYYGACYYITQMQNAMPLFLGIVPENARKKVEEMLLWQIKEARGKLHLTTGLIGTKYLIEALSETGHEDTIYDIFNSTEYPSWGFMLKKNATTIWERWEYMIDNEMNSHNHPPLAAPDSWLYQRLAGIKPLGLDEKKHMIFEFKPYFAKQLDFVEAEMDTFWGIVKIRWKRSLEELNINISIPQNCFGRINIQSLNKSLLPGKHHFKISNIKNVVKGVTE